MFYTFESPVGRLIIRCDGENITELCVCNDEDNDVYSCRDVPSVVKELVSWLELYFSGVAVSTFEKIAPDGTEFQKEVWDILRRIPYGTTVTYGDIAKEIAERRGIERMSAQAVGNAVGKNHILIAVPCHRVVASNGIGGFEYGIDMKKVLLRTEKVDIEAL